MDNHRALNFRGPVPNTTVIVRGEDGIRWKWQANRSRWADGKRFISDQFLTLMLRDEKLPPASSAEHWDYLLDSVWAECSYQIGRKEEGRA